MAEKDSEGFVQKLIIDHYDLGIVKRVREIKAGDTNNSFLAFCEKDGRECTWYVRQYNPAEEERDIIYEHAFEAYLNARIDKQMQTLLPVHAKDGNTWVLAEYKGQSNFYAVFNKISGREPYSWEYNDLSEEAFVSCAEITAKFQAWGYGFEGPRDGGRREPSLKEQFGNWRMDLPSSIKEKEKNRKVFRRYTDYLRTEEDFLLKTIDFCEAELNRYEGSLKKCINHKDLNPGNLMFDERDRVCGIFDLDWVNLDYRLYDVAWMGYQAIASWDTRSWGIVPLEKMGKFLEIYNQTMLAYGCPLGELTIEERKFLPTMMIIGALKVVMDFACYEEHAHDVHRVFANTWRFVSSIRYMMEHLEEMTEQTMKVI